MPNRASSLSFLKAFFQGSFLSILRTCTGFIRTKYVAVSLGTVGVGYLAQANQFHLLGLTLASLSMAVGIINLFSEFGSDKTPLKLGSHLKQDLLSTAFTSQAIVTVAFFVICALFSQTLSYWIFGGPQWSIWVVILAAGIPFASLASGYIEGIFFGANRYDLYIKASSIAAVLGLLFTLILIYLKGLMGAILAFSLSSALLFCLFVFYVRKIMPLRKVFRFGWNTEIFSKLLKYTVVSLSTGVLTYGSALIIRRMVLSRLGADSNGLLQVPIALSNYLAPFITSGLWGRLHPIISAKPNKDRKFEEFNTSLQLTAWIAAILISTFLALKEWLVQLAFNKNFLPAIDLIPIQAIGDYFYLISFVFSVFFLADSKLRVYLLGWTAFFICQIILTLIFLPMYGIRSVPLAYLTSSVCMGLCCVVWYFRWCRQYALSQKKDENKVYPLDILKPAFTVIALGFVIGLQILVSSFFSLTELPFVFTSSNHLADYSIMLLGRSVLPIALALLFIMKIRSSLLRV